MNNQSRNIWQVRVTGATGCTWEHFTTKNIIAFSSAGSGSGECKSIITEKMGINDIVVVTDSKSEKILGIGVINSDYYETSYAKSPSYGNFGRIRDVKWWEIKESIKIETPIPSDGSSIVDVKRISSEDYEVIKKWYSKQNIDLNVLNEHPKNERHIMEFKLLPALAEAINNTKNIILYGSPGTGKTYIANQFAEVFLQQQLNPEQNLGDSKYLKFVTFHQSFAYEDFLEGIKPKISEIEKGLEFEVVPGVFKQICMDAEKEPHNKYLIIIDEINRANISKVFGELITLIEDDKRLGTKNELEVTLPYSKEKFGVPKNLYILGTMNISDRSIALLDIALRRRFAFIELKPNPELLKDRQIEDVSLKQLLTTLNRRITVLIGRDYQIGHSYFINIESLAELRFIWYYRIIPLLQEYFYNDSERLKAVLGDFMKEIKIGSNENSSLSKFTRGEIQYKIEDLQDDEKFKSALLSIYMTTRTPKFDEATPDR
jgi:5-methylcytosine-specific restriction endonuclease McrBC GTP-binding regulatory subunit McrB